MLKSMKHALVIPIGAQEILDCQSLNSVRTTHLVINVIYQTRKTVFDHISKHRGDTGYF